MTTNEAVARLLAWTGNPVLEAAFVAAVRSREPIKVDRLPPALFPAAVLLEAIAQEWKEPSIVDDWRFLYEAARAEYNERVPRLKHPESYVVTAILFQNANDIANNPQTEYIGVAYRELTGTFEEEAPARKKGRKQNV
jgi:hypothetical protein